MQRLETVGDWSATHVPLLIAVGALGVLLATAPVVVRRVFRRRPLRGDTVRPAVRVPILRGIPAVNVADVDSPVGALYPMLAEGGVDRTRRLRLWIYQDSKRLVPTGSVGLSRATERVLGVRGEPEPVAIALPSPVLVKAVPAPALDLPAGASIHVGKEVFAKFRGPGFARRALLTAPNGVSFPVRLHRRDLDPAIAQVPMALRTLAGIKTDTQVQLTELPRLTGWERRSNAFGRVFTSTNKGSLRRHFGVIVGTLMIAVRFLDYVVELLLRVLLRSQPICLRVTQANPGDDDLRDTVKLHEAAFTTLAARPGGHVMVKWANQSMAVRALEDPTPITGGPSEHVLDSVGLHLDVERLPPGFPAHLVVRIPAPIRRTLNIPPDTIVEVRRRLRPAATAQLNAVTIPTAGLILAGAALPPVRGWPLAVGALTSLVLGMAPLRASRAPKGTWP